MVSVIVTGPVVCPASPDGWKEKSTWTFLARPSLSIHASIGKVDLPSRSTTDLRALSVPVEEPSLLRSTVKWKCRVDAPRTSSVPRSWMSLDAAFRYSRVWDGSVGDEDRN